MVSLTSGRDELHVLHSQPRPVHRQLCVRAQVRVVSDPADWLAEAAKQRQELSHEAAEVLPSALRVLAGDWAAYPCCAASFVPRPAAFIELHLAS